MTTPALLLLSVLWTAQPPPSSTEAPSEAGEVSAEPEGGAGITPVELIPRVELRQSFVQQSSGVTINTTTTELDIQFLARVLLRYELPVVVLKTPTGQVSGLGDVRLTGLFVITSSPTTLTGVIAGAVLDTATQAPLGAGRQQVFFGGGVAYKPRPWWLIYAVAQD